MPSDEEILNNAAVELADEEEPSTPVKLSPAVTFVSEDEMKHSLLGEIDRDLVTKITRNAVDKLNFGLLISTLDVILDLQRTKEKITNLEAIIYNPQGINTDKDIISLYNSEKAYYNQQLEIVRKYVLNNKSALEEMNKPTQELVDVLMHLPADKVEQLTEIVKKMANDEDTGGDSDSGSEDNLLDE